MRVIAKSSLVKFCRDLPRPQQATAQAAMAEWYATVSSARWKTFSDVKATFNSADYVSNGKIVFDVGGNKFRIVALIGFRTERVFILLWAPMRNMIASMLQDCEVTDGYRISTNPPQRSRV